MKASVDRRSWMLGLLLVVPALGFQVAFHVWPIFYSLYISVLNWNLLQKTTRFVGLANYAELLKSRAFWQVVGNTAFYSVGTVVLTISLGLVLAVFLNEKTRFSGFVQGAVFAPYVISFVSVSLLWLWILDPQWGLLNGILTSAGLPKLRWIASPTEALPSLILVSVWRGSGYAMLLCLAGLQSVPRDLYEAAEVEGAHKWRQFWSITVPLLSPTLFFLLIVTTLNTFQVFDIVAIMTSGGPADSTNVWVYYIYKYAFEFFRIGQASAAAVILFLVLGLITLIQFKYVQRRVFYS